MEERDLSLTKPSGLTGDTNQKVFVVDVVRGRGRRGEAKTGKERLLTADTDNLYTLREAARASLRTVPKDNWPEGKTADEIVNDIVSKVLDGPVGSDVHDITLPGNIMVRLRTERAAHYGVTGEYPESPKYAWEMTRAEILGEGDMEMMQRGIYESDIGYSPAGKATIISAHRALVKEAVEAGKDVPGKVLLDYPELLEEIEERVREVWGHIELVQEQLDEVGSEHESECAAFGDARPGQAGKIKSLKEALATEQASLDALLATPEGRSFTVYEEAKKERIAEWNKSRVVSGPKPF